MKNKPVKSLIFYKGENDMEKYEVFVSYRRDGGEALVCLISERLNQREYSVFYDVESLDPESLMRKYFR